MKDTSDQDLVREIISTCRYLSLSTTDGNEPWIATIEYLHDDQLNFYFLSTDDSRHVQHIDKNPMVALAIFETTQPEYSPEISVTLRGIQVSGSASRCPPEDCPESISAAIRALNPPMPPYGCFKVSPTAFYIPKVVKGLNERVEVKMS